MGMAKDSKIDAVDEQLNYLANSMNDWEQSEHALSEAAAMLSGIARSHSGEEDEEKQLEALKQGLDDITASISRMNAAAREDMADVIEQTQRDNELLEAINVEPILEGTPQSEYEVKSEPATANQVKISKVKPLEDTTSGMDIDKIAGLFASSNQVKKVSKVKPLEDATSGMDVSKLAGLHKTSSHKEGKSAKASKHSKASKPAKNTSGSEFETVITPENEVAEDGFRFVAERELAANPVEWKMDESVLQAFSAAKESPKPDIPEGPVTGAEPISKPEFTDNVSFSSESNAVQSEGDSLSTIRFESENPAVEQTQAESFLSGSDTAQAEDSLSTIRFETDDSPAAESLASASFLSEDNESLLQTLPEANLSVPDTEEPQPAEMAEPSKTNSFTEAADNGMANKMPGADMQISNDMFDLGIDLSDEPDYSDENIDLNVFSGSIEDAEQYNAAPENSVDLDAEYADSNLDQEMDLSNLVAAAMNDLAAGRSYEAESEEAPEEGVQLQTMDDSPAEEEDYNDVPTVSNIENELKKAESEKRRSEGDEVRQQESAGFAYALNEVDQAAAAAEDEENSEKRVIAQYLVHKRGEEERSYYRLVFQ